MNAGDQSGSTTLERGPPISDERRGILSFIDRKIRALRRRSKGAIDGDPTSYAAQVLGALRDDLRQELDRGDRL